MFPASDRCIAAVDETLGCWRVHLALCAALLEELQAREAWPVMETVNGAFHLQPLHWEMGVQMHHIFGISSCAVYWWIWLFLSLSELMALILTQIFVLPT